MIERPAAGERAVIVQLDFGADDIAEQVEEVRLLAESAGASVCAVVRGRRQSPDPATFAGKGKVEEVAAEVAAHEANLVIFNHELSPAQERNLERVLHCRVVDRTSLILDIFAQRAKTSDGKLQVELPNLITSRRVSFVGGHTLSGKRAGSVCADLVKRSWKRTGVC